MKDIRGLLNTKYPIIQGGMAWIAESTLCAAVSNAGGFGIIASGSAPASFVRDEIRKAKELTKNPFGVNVMMLNPDIDNIMDVIAEEKPFAITTGAGNPGKYIEKLKAAGVKVIPVVASVALAIRLERLGVDALIAEGLEAGGHIGEMTTFTLVPQVVDAVKIPVIAAGGIADSRGVNASFCLGAKGVQVATAFLVSDEIKIHENYKNMILKASDSSSVVTGRSTGHPVRGIKNKGTREILRLEKEGITPEEFEEKMAGTLRAAVVDGDVDYGSVMSGQIAGMIKEKNSVEGIIKSIFKDVKL